MTRRAVRLFPAAEACTLWRRSGLARERAGTCQLLAFYKSPLGQKMIAQTPRIMQEGMAIGQSWGRRIGQRVVQRIRRAAKQKGYDL